MYALLPEPRIQFCDANGKPLDGGWIYTCLPGGSITDLKASYQTATGTAHANPIELDSAGRATIFLDGYYHIFVTDAEDAAIYDVDNVSAQSFTFAVTVQWQLYPDTPTYVSGLSFTVPGNVTSLFPIGERIKASISTGTLIYGTVSSVTAGGSPVATTVSVIWDSGALDSGLSAIYTGIITPTDTSLPIIPVTAENATVVLTMAQMNRILVGSSATAMNFTLPTTVPSGTFSRIHNSGVGTITLVGTINGVSSPTVQTQSDAILFNDGSSWYGLFYDPAHGTFTATLEVGSAGGFPAFSVDNSGNITVTGGEEKAAAGIITFTGVPDLGHTFGINGHTFTWVASGTADGNVVQGGTAAICAANAITSINRDGNDVVVATAVDTTHVLVTALTAGAAGNSIAFTENNSDTAYTINGPYLGNTILGGFTWVLYFGTTGVLQIDDTYKLTVLTRGFMSIDPTTDLEIATKGYVDDAIAGTAGPIVAANSFGSFLLLPHPIVNNTGFPASAWAVESTILPLSLSGYYTLGNSIVGGTSGFFHNVFITQACNAYFHFYGVHIAGDGVSEAVTYGWRIGYVTSPAIGTSANTADIFPTGRWPAPSDFSVRNEYGPGAAGVYHTFFDHEVIGPVALTPGWYSIFVQVYHHVPSNAAINLTDFWITGGLLMTLSAS